MRMREVVLVVVVGCGGDNATPPGGDASLPVIFDGDLVVSSAAGARLLVDVNIVTGSLTIEKFQDSACDLPEPHPCGRVDVPKLESVGGDLVLRNASFPTTDQLLSITFSALTTVEGGLVVSAPSGTTDDSPILPLAVELPRVERLDFVRIKIDWNPGEQGLTNRASSLAMPALTTIDGALELSSTELADLSLPALQTASSIDIRFNAKLCNAIAMQLATQTGAPSMLDGNAVCAQ